MARKEQLQAKNIDRGERLPEDEVYRKVFWRFLQEYDQPASFLALKTPAEKARYLKTYIQPVFDDAIARGYDPVVKKLTSGIIIIETWPKFAESTYTIKDGKLTFDTVCVPGSRGPINGPKLESLAAEQGIPLSDTVPFSPEAVGKDPFLVWEMVKAGVELQTEKYREYQAGRSIIEDVLESSAVTLFRLPSEKEKLEQINTLYPELNNFKSGLEQRYAYTRANALLTLEEIAERKSLLNELRVLAQRVEIVDNFFSVWNPKASKAPVETETARQKQEHSFTAELFTNPQAFATPQELRSPMTSLERAASLSELVFQVVDFYRIEIEEQAKKDGKSPGKRSGQYFQGLVGNDLAQKFQSGKEWFSEPAKRVTDILTNNNVPSDLGLKYLGNVVAGVLSDLPQVTREQIWTISEGRVAFVSRFALNPTVESTKLKRIQTRTAEVIIDKALKAIKIDVEEILKVDRDSQNQIMTAVAREAKESVVFQLIQGLGLVYDSQKKIFFQRKEAEENEPELSALTKIFLWQCFDDNRHVRPGVLEPLMRIVFQAEIPRILKEEGIFRENSWWQEDWRAELSKATQTLFNSQYDGLSREESQEMIHRYILAHGFKEILYRTSNHYSHSRPNNPWQRINARVVETVAKSILSELVETGRGKGLAKEFWSKTSELHQLTINNILMAKKSELERKIWQTLSSVDREIISSNRFVEEALTETLRHGERQEGDHED